MAVDLLRARSRDQEVVLNPGSMVSIVDILARAHSLVEIASVSGEEREIASFVQNALEEMGDPWEVLRVGDNVVARAQLPFMRESLLLAGHLDTVPHPETDPARITGSALEGPGAVDMKGGLAVMLSIAEAVCQAQARLADVGAPGAVLTLVFYAREEIERSKSGLLEIEAEDPSLLSPRAAILLEPTGGRVEAGCQGTARFKAVLRGRRAHTARPWTGINAIHRAGRLLQAVMEAPLREVVLDGCTYKESLQATGISGGGIGNVVPDRAEVVLNLRYAPDRDSKAAREWLEGVLAPALDLSLGDALELVDAADGALPRLREPILAELVRTSRSVPRAKLGWTDVAFFSSRGVPACNYGPGDPELAHGPAERVSREELLEVRRNLGSLIGID
jgi:succinyl-diaminopimelate desuccinylase